MTLRIFRIPAAFVFSTLLLAAFALTPTYCAAQQSPYGGTTIEQIIARVNDQIITGSDYDRAMKELDDEQRQRGATMQEMSAAHENLLRNLIDQQLWLSKGKELDITGETALVNRLNDVRKQYHLATMEDLEKAAKEQGISFEDFKANIRNQIITQEVMREEVGQKLQFTPGDVERYFEAHKKDYAQQESVTLAEILVSTGTQAPSATEPGELQPVDTATLAAAKSKAGELEAKLNAGGNFAELARTFSDGPTAAEGGDLGQFHRGALAKVLEDSTFALKAGQYTEPIRTRQGFVILKVEKNTPGGVPSFKDVEPQVEDAFYMSMMEPAMRAYLTTMREQAFIDIKPGYSDTGASSNETKPIYSAYTPPSPKKKKKVERTRFRESTHNARGVSKRGKKQERVSEASMKPGKKEKIRYGQSPTETLPSAPQAAIEDAGAGQQQESSLSPEPVNPLETRTGPEKKMRFSERARQPKKHKTKESKELKVDAMAPAAPDAPEVADRETQSAPLGLAGDTAKKMKKKPTTKGEKTRMSDEKSGAKAPTPGEEAKKKDQTKAQQDSADVHGW